MQPCPPSVYYFFQHVSEIGVNQRSIRLKEYDDTVPAAYLITVVTYKHASRLGMVMETKVESLRQNQIIRLFWSGYCGPLN